MRGLERAGALDTLRHHCAELGDDRIVIFSGALDEIFKRNATLRSRRTKRIQLALSFVEMAAEPLQVLLHELRGLGKSDSAQHAERAVDQTAEEAGEAICQWHAGRLGVALG